MITPDRFRPSQGGGRIRPRDRRATMNPFGNRAKGNEWAMTGIDNA